MLAAPTGPLGSITFTGNPKDIVAFKQLIEDTALRSPFFASELQRIAFNPQSSRPILIRMSREEDHSFFGDNYKSNQVWMKDLKVLPANETAGADQLTQGWAVLHILEERWHEQSSGKDYAVDHAYAVQQGNAYRAQFSEPAIKAVNKGDKKYTFDDGSTEDITRELLTGRWRIKITHPKKSQNPTAGGSYYITWILGPLLSDNTDVYAGIAFPSSNIAEFSASDRNGPVSNPADFTAMILWGDGSTSQGRVVNYEEGGYVYSTEFVVLGSHTYAKPDDYDIQVQIVQASGYSENNAIVNNAIVDDSAAVSWLSAPAIPNSRIGVGFVDAVIGVFLGSWDGDPDPNAVDFQAQVAWGDGTFSSGEIVRADGAGDPSNEFMVLASHTYQQAGDFQVQTQISDGASFTQDDTTNNNADVLS